MSLAARLSSDSAFRSLRFFPARLPLRVFLKLPDPGSCRELRVEVSALSAPSPVARLVRKEDADEGVLAGTDDLEWCGRARGSIESDMEMKGLEGAACDADADVKTCCCTLLPPGANRIGAASRAYLQWPCGMRCKDVQPSGKSAGEVEITVFPAAVRASTRGWWALSEQAASTWPCIQ